MDKILLIGFNLVLLCVCEVNSEPKDYAINYKGGFSQLSYNKNGSNANNTGSNEEKTIFNVSQHHIDVISEDKYNLKELLSGFANTIQKVFGHSSKVKAENLYNASHEIENKTKILVNAFALHDMIGVVNNTAATKAEDDKEEGNDKNVSTAKVPVTIDDIIISLKEDGTTVASVKPAIKDRYPKSIFSKSFFNDVLLESVPKNITKLNLENEQISNTSFTTIDSTKINKEKNTSETEKNTKGLIFLNTTFNNQNIEEVKLNYEKEILKKLDSIKIDFLSDVTKNNTTSTTPTYHIVGITEDLSLESIFNGANFMSLSKDAFSLRNDSIQNEEKRDVNLTSSEAASTLNSSIYIEEPTQEISIVYESDATEKSEESLKLTTNQTNPLSTVGIKMIVSLTTKTANETEPNTSTTSNTKTESKTSPTTMTTKPTTTTATPSTIVPSVLTLTKSIENTPELLSSTAELITEVSTTATVTTPELLSSTTNLINEISTTSTASTVEVTNHKQISEASRKSECKNVIKQPRPIINDMKWINVDQILILLPVITHIQQNLTAVQNVTENALNTTKLNLQNNPMNDHLKTHKEMKYEFDKKEILKRDKDNELYDDTIDIDDILNDNSSGDYLGIDYVDYYKDVVLDDVVVTTTESSEADMELIKSEVEHNLLQYALQASDGSTNNQYARSVNDCHGNATTLAEAVFPWIVTIFHKNGNTDQFEYFCDGVLLNNKAVLTSARCVSLAGREANPSQLIVILGKRNLKAMQEQEVVVRVSKLIVHPNFLQPSSAGFVEDDLAIVMLDSVVPMGGSIRAACLDCQGCGGVEQSATTGWALTGDLNPVFFKKENKDSEVTEKKIEGTYGLDVTICPSHGGIFLVQRQGAWYVRGVSASNPNDHGLCIIRTLQYTSLRTYMDWINNVID